MVLTRLLQAYLQAYGGGAVAQVDLRILISIPFRGSWFAINSIDLKK